MSAEFFGAILKRLREAKGLKQGEFAEKMGVKREHITRLEGNKDASPSWETVQRLAAALGVSTDEFKTPPKKKKKPAKKK